MTLSGLQSEAENYITDELEKLRDSVTVDIAGSDFTGWAGSTLRTNVANKIKNFYGYSVQAQVKSYLREAAKEGAERATSELKATGSATQLNLSSFEDTVSYAFQSLLSDLSKKITIPLARASLGAGGLKDVLDTGKAFEDAESRARGILTNEIQIVSSHGYQKRSEEIRKHHELQQKTKVPTKDEVRVAITIWRHSSGGNPPRENHVAMDGKGVVAGHTFALKGEDGTTYNTLGPHLPPLPPAETINCHCIALTRVLFVTKKEADDLTKESVATGGFLDGRWK